MSYAVDLAPVRNTFFTLLILPYINETESILTADGKHC